MGSGRPNTHGPLSDGGSRADGPSGFEHQSEHASLWDVIASIAGKFGCNIGMLQGQAREAECDNGTRAGAQTEGRERIHSLGLEVRELRQANEILRKARAHIAIAKIKRPLK